MGFGHSRTLVPLQEGHFAFSACGYAASRQAQLLGSGFQEDVKDILRYSMVSFLLLRVG